MDPARIQMRALKVDQIAQKIPVASAVVGTTPQDIALLDVSRAVHMFRKLAALPTLNLKIDRRGQLKNGSMQTWWYLTRQPSRITPPSSSLTSTTKIETPISLNSRVMGVPNFSNLQAG